MAGQRKRKSRRYEEDQDETALWIERLWEIDHKRAARKWLTTRTGYEPWGEESVNPNIETDDRGIARYAGQRLSPDDGNECST